MPEPQPLSRVSVGKTYLQTALSSSSGRGGVTFAQRMARGLEGAHSHLPPLCRHDSTPQVNGSGMGRPGRPGEPGAEPRGTCDAWSREKPHVPQQHTACPEHQRLCQPRADTLAVTIKATNTDEARKEYGEKAACLRFSDSPEDSRKAFSYPLQGKARFLYRSIRKHGPAP